MDRLNDRIKAMFDMVGTQISQNIRTISNQILNPDSQNQSLGNNLKQDYRSSQNQSNNSSSSSVPRSSSINRSQSLYRMYSRSRNASIERSSVCSKKTKKRNNSHSSNVARGESMADHSVNNSPVQKPQCNLFAPGLLHSAMFTDNSANANQHFDLSNNRYNCAVYVIHCVQHRRMAVTRPSNKQALWLPFTPIPNNRSWNDACLAGLLIILSGANMDTFLALKDKPPFTERFMMEVFDIQLPQTLEIITRLTWYIKLDTNPNKHFRCCHDSETLMWVSEKTLEKGVLEYMWGPELIQFYRKVKNRQGPMACTFDEYNLDMAFQFLPRNPPRTDEEAMLCSSNLSEKDIERLYSDFLEHCFPSMSMTLHSFKVYMTKYGFQFNDSRLSYLFLAFNYSSNGYITFPELLMGLACIDIHSIHNEARAKFVMRYYDVGKRGYLTREDIRLMICDMHPNSDPADIDAKLTDILSQMELDPKDNNRITYRAFVSAIGTHRFRGTSKLCRIERPIFLMISNVIFSRMKKKDSKYNLQMASVIEPSYAGVCLGCKEKKPYLDDYLIRVNKDGYVVTQEKLKTGARNEQQTKSARITKSRQNLSKSRSKKKLSQQALVPLNDDDPDDEAKVAARTLIRLIHDFSPRKGDTRRPNGLLCATFKERDRFYNLLTTIEKKLLPIFERETRCMMVSSPAYVIGDIHGNLEDLLSLEKSIWKRYPVIGANLVFLGDFVDRGKWSVECATYLFAMKVLMPNKVTMLRGNHEVRALQCHYSYRFECLNKYGDDLGPKIWELTNRLFDRLPLCAVIDEVIFCAHGGIPRSTLELNEIQKLPTVIGDPEHESRVAWEILWSDPIHQQQFLEMACLLKDDVGQREGYLFNKKRGTAFVFNEDAANQFMATNGLTHIIRAHEVPTNGFFFHFDKKCATIFSCSHYCGNSNECACVLVDLDLLRIIRIDTTNNMSATD